MLYVGIDPSLSGLGLIAVDDRGEIVYRRTISTSNIGNKSRERINRCLNIANTVVKALETVESLGLGKIAGIFIEGYAFGTNRNAHYLAELGGLLRFYILIKWPTLIEEIPPATLKKFATGSGAPDKGKARVMECVRRKWGVGFASNDEADAYVLARMCAVAYCDCPRTQAEQDQVRIALGLEIAPSKVAKTKAALKKKERAKKLAQQKRFANMIEKKKERKLYPQDFPF